MESKFLQAQNKIVVLLLQVSHLAFDPVENRTVNYKQAKQNKISDKSSKLCKLSFVYTFFYKKLGSGHRTKSFLISHEILSILVLKVS